MADTFESSLTTEQLQLREAAKAADLAWRSSLTESQIQLQTQEKETKIATRNARAEYKKVREAYFNAKKALKGSQ